MMLRLRNFATVESNVYLLSGTDRIKLAVFSCPFKAYKQTLISMAVSRHSLFLSHSDHLSGRRSTPLFLIILRSFLDLGLCPSTRISSFHNHNNLCVSSQTQHLCQSSPVIAHASRVSQLSAATTKWQRSSTYK